MVTLLLYRGRSRQAQAARSRTAGEEGGARKEASEGRRVGVVVVLDGILSVEPSLGAGCFYNRIDDLRGYLPWEQKRRKDGVGDAAV